MSEHTPGPWTHGPLPDGNSYWVAHPSGMVAMVVTSEADARLIAAAPEMLAMLKQVEFIYDNTHPWYHDLCTTIAEAEGR